MTGFKLDQVLTHDGSFTIRHPVYDEEFHSKTGARLETLELYMKASGYADALSIQSAPFGILDVGLGLGYNALMTLDLWMNGPGLDDIHMLSLEHTEPLLEALTDPQTAWKQGWSHSWKDWSHALTRQADGLWTATFQHPLTQKKFAWTAQVRDAREADFEGHSFDYVWQDAFSSKKNPELWTEEWFKKIADAANPSVTLVTYSVARLVRDSLEAAGWSQERFKASGLPTDLVGTKGKKSWLRARLIPSGTD